MSIGIPGGVGQILQLINQGGQQTPQPGTGGQNNTASDALKPGSQHTGTITAQAAGGRLTLTLQTGQTVQLQQAGKPLPVGTQVTIKITPEGGAQILNLTLPGVSVKADLLTSLATRWPGLVQALSILQDKSSYRAEQLTAKIPTLQNLFTGLTQFSQAVQTGQQQTFLGDSLSQALLGLGIDFSADLSNLQQLHQPQGPDSWRALLFPYIENDGEDPRQGGFFWREQERQEEDGTTHKDIRFVVQLETKAHGPVQLDGLWHERNVHLKLRLHQPPADPNFTPGLQEITQAALSAYGLQGGIQVEITPTFPTNPIQETVGASHSDYNLST